MRMMKAAWAVVLLGVLVAACNSGGPTGASAGISPTVRGRFVGGAFAGAADVSRMSVAADDIIVRVLEDPAVSVKVSSDGTFTLRGLPAGTFTLLFTRGGTVIGQQTFTSVAPNQEITLQVELLDDGEVVVVDERRTGIGHGDIEIEGEIEKITTGSNGETRLLVDGKTVIIKPGETSIRDEDNQLVLVTDLKVGMFVHIKGVWVEGSTTDVVATGILVQEEGDDDGDGAGAGEGKATICHIPPGNKDNKKTLEVGVSAVPAHMAHGDTMGACAGSAGPKNKGPENKGKPDNKGKPENKGGGKK
jgi:hypothetical protein